MAIIMAIMVGATAVVMVGVAMVAVTVEEVVIIMVGGVIQTALVTSLRKTRTASTCAVPNKIHLIPASTQVNSLAVRAIMEKAIQ